MSPAATQNLRARANLLQRQALRGVLHSVRRRRRAGVHLRRCPGRVPFTARVLSELVHDPQRLHEWQVTAQRRARSAAWAIASVAVAVGFATYASRSEPREGERLGRAIRPLPPMSVEARPVPPPRRRASAPPAPGSDPGRLRCGSVDCELESERCCQSWDGAKRTCVARDRSCDEASLDLACDESADCPPSLWCCLRPNSAQCLASCGPPPAWILCKQTEDCPVAQLCTGGHCSSAPARDPHARARLRRYPVP